MSKKNPENVLFTDGWDGWDGMDGISKVSFNFLYTLLVYRSCICILIYIVKSCHQHSYGFQNLMSSWGVGVRFSKLPFSHDFFKIMPKVGCFKNTSDNGPFLAFF